MVNPRRLNAGKKMALIGLRLKRLGSDGIRGSCIEFLQIRPAGICPADFKTSTNCYEKMEPLIEGNREMLAGFAEIAAVA
jgi:hypothetical protein